MSQDEEEPVAPATPQINFPTTFCCNCGDTACSSEIQHTRLTRFFGIRGSDTQFQLPIPICTTCRRTMRRRPAGFFSRLSVLIAMMGLVLAGLFALPTEFMLPLWVSGHVFWISAVLALILAFVFYRFRRPKPPQTSFYQPVRIKGLKVQVTDVMNAHGQVAYLKMAFTNAEYLGVFIGANQDSIRAGRIAAVKA